MQQHLPYTRAYLHPELRENWATWALWLQVALVCRCLRGGAGGQRADEGRGGTRKRHAGEQCESSASR